MLTSIMNSMMQDLNPEKFNLDLVYQRKRTYTSSLQGCLDDACSALELIDGIKYLGSQFIIDENEISRIMNKSTKEISRSRIIMAVMKFRLSYDGESKEIALRLFLPKIVNNFYFILNGNYYSSIYQMIDKGTYTTEFNLSLKTLLMPIIYNTDKTPLNIQSVCKTVNLTESVIRLDLFKKQVNLFYYFMAKKGFTETLKFFGMLPEDILIINKDKDDEVLDYNALNETMYEFKMTNTRSIYIYKKVIDNKVMPDHVLVTLVGFLLQAKPTSNEEMDNLEFWKIKLGRLYSTNPNSVVSKSESIIISLERILDLRTKKNLVHIHENDKRDIYCVLRWMLTFYKELRAEDNMNLANKRIRLSEYILHPLILKFSESTYRIFNSRKVTLAKLETIFSNIHPDFCIRRLITNKLLRYLNITNTMDLFTTLKVTQSGPQGIGDNEIAIRYRGIHESYIGKVGLVAASAGDPGATMTISPFATLQDNSYFDTNIYYQTNYDQYYENEVNGES